MGYIIKENQGLLVTRLTDVGRRKISEGNFNVAYFQIGDSEVNYTALSSYDNSDYMVLEPPYNAQNNVGIPQSTRTDIKYPFYLQGFEGITYGIPFMASADDSVYNTAAPNGFFVTASTASTCFMPYHTSAYTYNSQYVVNLASSSFNGGSSILTMSSSPCVDSASGTTISAGTFVTIYMSGGSSCGCIDSCYPILTYNVIEVNGLNITLDRFLPDLNTLGYTGSARLFFYPSGMTGYDLPTPMNYWNDSVINYESVCTPEDGLVKIWNMNIPWSVNPAGITTPYRQFNDFGSKDYISSKEYFGYMSSSGQSGTSNVYYYNSFDEEIVVTPEEQKAIAIVHYTNNTIINFYGEKFACEAYDSTTPGATGQARNFSINLPWLMWHKNPTSCCSGETFWIDPAGFDNYDLLTPYYLKSLKNSDMNSPGMRYYHLYDTHANPVTGLPNRVGKVFPDDKTIIFDDEEIVAVMNNISNRNYTLPAPKLGLVTPGSCGDNTTDGLLDNDQQCAWVTYAFQGPWQGLHCNYYQKIIGPSTGCSLTEQNVIVRFGDEFGCMTTGATNGYNATGFTVLVQTGTTSQTNPDPTQWVAINYTNSLSGYTVGGYINPIGLSAVTYTITPTLYSNGTSYDLGSQINIPLATETNYLGFGDEYSFYGNVNTDIQATIYEMRYLINLPNNQFVNTTNPTWTAGVTPYMSEIGLYDVNKNLLVLAKFQSPQIRQGVQQAVVKLDF
jgi:hypothetical protein